MFVFLRHRTSVKTLSPQKVFFVLPGENRQFCYQFYCFVMYNSKIVDSYNLLNTNLCLSTWYKTNKNWNRTIYNIRFSKGLTKKHTTFLWKIIINWTVVKGFYIKNIFSLEKILNPEGTQPHKVKNIFYSLCVLG